MKVTYLSFLAEVSD